MYVQGVLQCFSTIIIRYIYNNISISLRMWLYVCYTISPVPLNGLSSLLERGFSVTQGWPSAEIILGVSLYIKLYKTYLSGNRGCSWLCRVARRQVTEGRLSTQFPVSISPRAKIKSNCWAFVLCHVHIVTQFTASLWYQDCDLPRRLSNTSFVLT